MEYTQWKSIPWYSEDGDVGGIILFFEIITKHKKTENDLRERVKELSCVYKVTELSNTPDIKINDFFEKAVEFIREGMLHPDDAMARITYMGYDFVVGESKHPDKHVTISEEIHFGNDKVGLLQVSYCEDCSKAKSFSFLKEEKKMLEMIARIISDLLQRKQIEDDLIETNKNLEEMIYIASHDLQAPLVSIEGYTSEMLDTYKDKLDEEGLFCLKRLQSNSRRMHKLVSVLLDISRLSAASMHLEKINLNTIVKNIITDLSLVISEAKVEVTVKKLPHILADRVRFESVIRNLIVNSINYGGKNIDISFKDNILSIKDDGIGIPEGQLETIFTPGERLKIIKVDGIGMGLAFCKKVILLHNGKIWAESEGMNKGTTIKIRLDPKKIL